MTIRWGSMLLVAALCASACGSDEDSKDETRTIVLIKGIAGNPVEPFYAKMNSGASAKVAGMENVEYIVDGADMWDYKLQAPLVQKYIDAKVDAILIAPNDKNEMVDVLEKASKAGIIVITVDTFLGDGDYKGGPVKFPTAFVGSDNKKGGEVACDDLAKAIGGAGKVYVQDGVDGISSTDDRRDGCLAHLAAMYPDIEVLAEVGYDTDDPEVAKTQTAAVLAANPDLKGVFGCNLHSGSGAGEAVDAAGKNDDVYVVSFDATKSCVALLERTAVDMCLAQIPAKMGEIGVDYALRALSGEKNVPKKTLTQFVVVTNANHKDAEIAQYVY
jgi:ribose transport system substrate-binding protein